MNLRHALLALGLVMAAAGGGIAPWGAEAPPAPPDSGGAHPPGVPGEGTGYAWPLLERGCVTSSFMEYRARHFHGGIDLSTGGEEGMPVLAVADGEVWRVSVSPRGYGRSLHLRLDDGRFAVYGHLSAYAGAIEAWVREAQCRERRYSQQLRPAPGQFRVRRGDVVAYSGQSGAGPPHLHFELRENESDALNPAMHGFHAPDAGAPVPRAVAVEPLDAHGVVDGRAALASFPVVRARDGRGYVMTGVPRLSGVAGFSVAAIDGTPGCDARLAPYRWELRVDGRSVFEATLDRASFTTAPECDVIYRAGPAGERFFRLHRVWQLPASTTGTIRGDGMVTVVGGVGRVPHFTMEDLASAAALLRPERPRYLGTTLEHAGVDTASAGAATAPWRILEGTLVAPGEHRIEILLRDLAGNETRITGRFLAEHDDAVTGRSGGSRRGRASSSRKESQHAAPSLSFEWRRGFVEAFADLSREVTSPPVLRAGGTEVTMRHVDGTRWAATLVPPRASDTDVEIVARDAGGRDLSLRAPLPPAVLVRRGTAATVGIGEGAGCIEFETNALYFDTLFRVTPAGPGPEGERAPDAGDGLEGVGAAWRIEANDVVFDRYPWMGLAAPDSIRDDVRVALYRRDGAGSTWRYVGREPGAGNAAGTIGGEDRLPGTLALLRDVEPPGITDFVMTSGPGDSIEIRATVGDTGSGIDADSVSLTIEGAWVPAEWDPERSLVRYVTSHMRDDRAMVELTLVDRAGNRRTMAPLASPRPAASGSSQ